MRISCGYKDLTDHIDNKHMNATYLSPLIQNNFIDICGKIIQDEIVEKINSAKCFSILVDETTIIFLCEQLSLCVRYSTKNIDINNDYINTYFLREDFLKYVPVYSTRGQNLATVILDGLKCLDIKLSIYVWTRVQ